jgi:hypothetical protein
LASTAIPAVAELAEADGEAVGEVDAQPATKSSEAAVSAAAENLKIDDM